MLLGGGKGSEQRVGSVISFTYLQDHKYPNLISPIHLPTHKSNLHNGQLHPRTLALILIARTKPKNIINITRIQSPLLIGITPQLIPTIGTCTGDERFIRVIIGQKPKLLVDIGRVRWSESRIKAIQTVTGFEQAVISKLEYVSHDSRVLIYHLQDRRA